MADIPQEAVMNWHTLKPSSFAAFCLMCKVKDSRQPDVYLDLAKAETAGIHKSAYYFALTELQKENWIEFSRTLDGKKRWKLLKGFVAESAKADVEPETNSANAENTAEQDSANAENSANVEFEAEKLSANVENSANAENEPPEIPQTWNENSANVENPPDPLIRINISKEELFKSQDSKESFDTFVRLFPNDEEIRKLICEKIGNKPKTKPMTPVEWNSIAEVFVFWKQTFDKNSNTRLTDERGRAVLDRLRSVNSYTVEEIKSAILGCRASPNHNGTRYEGAVYNDLELICRNDQQLERMTGYYEASQTGQKPKKDGTKNGTGNEELHRESSETGAGSAVESAGRRIFSSPRLE